MAKSLSDEIAQGIETTDIRPIRIHVNMEGLTRLRKERDSIMPLIYIQGKQIYCDGTIFANDPIPWRICANDPIATKL